ncbi:putative capsid protein [Sewage-associated circular DNA virus-4]|uniref:putative capsid protein n=1 Tax=Sewage-associated circular DNA virus-4 TaxID=1519393 RepID=UPI0004D1E550|nr:putative capsid protein [Sewage-associated circular DNA virus-4]AIF34811.1 putative capsid protein [Sewage-associated circular DNA virus-4]
MPKYAKRRKYTNRAAKAFKKSVPKTSTKTIRRIAVKAIKSQAETKNYYYHWLVQNQSTAFPYAHNAFYEINQGVGDNQRIGDKVYVSRLTYKLGFTIDSNFFAPFGVRGDIYVRCLLVQNKARQNNGITGFLPTWGGSVLMKSGYFQNGIVDKEQFTVLRDRNFHLSPGNAINGKQTYYRNISVRWAKNIQYDSDNGGYMKFKNTYLIYQIYSPDGYTTGGFTTNIVHNIQFKDL